MTDQPTGADETEPTPEDVRAVLGEVTDPTHGTDVVDAGAVAGVDVSDGAVAVDAALDSRDPETADLLADRMRSAVLELPGVSEVHVDADAAGPDHGIELDGVDRVVAVASAKGGVGKTTVATQLARGLAAEGESVGLFDADVYGPNVPDLLDLEGPLETTADGAAKPVERDGVQAISVGLIANDEPLAWRGSMAHEAVEELLTDAAWDVDTLVIDLPPGTGDIVLTALQSFPVDGAVLVSTPFPTAAGDTGRSETLFREQGVPILGAVFNMAGYTCPSCGDEHAPFGEPPEVRADVLAELPVDETLRSTEGDVPDPFRSMAGAVRSKLDEADRIATSPDALDLRGVPERARRDQLRTEYDALDPGESLDALVDQPPASLRSAVADAVDGDPETATARRDGGAWAVRFSKPARAEPPAAAGE
ncbi:P-loop NTPase [Halomicrobium salinisoli]|uniref:P-loop NTPase n=1 Tax=Halomicrobium salinisoli TaxID=2878391 RepID=UPI001CEFD447|nr:P-loop NTPase [Halomicrobium salinisoli]